MSSPILLKSDDDDDDEQQMNIELTEEERYLFEKLSQNQQRIQMQHQQLLIKAEKYLSYPLMNSTDLFFRFHFFFLLY